MKSSDRKPTRRTSRRRILINVGLSIVATLLALLVIEIGLRIVRSCQAPVTLSELEARRRHYAGRKGSFGHVVMASKNPRVIFELIPNIHVIWEGHEVRINSHGIRDDEFPREKPPNSIRIAFLGDSVSFGWLLAKEDAPSEILEEVFNEYSNGPRFQVMNFAVPGYNSAIEMEVLRSKALPLEPDVVILQYARNDTFLPFFVRKPENHWRLNRCYLWEFVRSRRWRWAKKKEESVPTGYAGLVDAAPLYGEMGGRGQKAEDPDSLPPYIRNTVGEKNCKNAIRGMATICKQRGIPTVLVINPPHPTHHTREKPASHSPIYASYIKTARDAGFTIADPTVAMLDFMEPRGVKDKDLHVDPVKNDSHPAPLRNTLTALEIARVILDGGMLPAGAIDRSRRDEVLAAFVKRADSQWNAMIRSRIPR